MQATTAQIKAINAILARAGQMENKADIVLNATNGRTTHSSAMSFEEARALLLALNRNVKTAQAPVKPAQKMAKKLFAMAHEMGWIKEITLVTPSGITKKKDYSAVHAWIGKFGYLHKPLSQYTYSELPKLVAQFEYGPYKHFLNKL